MTGSDSEAHRGDEPIEALLKKAPPRLAPPADDERAILEATREEWREVVARRSRHRRWRLAAAASFVAALSVALMTLPGTPIEPVAIASIEKSNGTIFLLLDRSELVALPSVDTVYSGQIIQTGNDGALGLSWGNGGSLRIDHDTRIEFIDAATVFVHRGRIYFDSESDQEDGGLLANTRFGTITHIGTQYMADVDLRELVLSVREGIVRVAGDYHERTAEAGKQVRLRGAAQPIVVDVPTYGQLWTWTEALSPRIDVDNRSAYEFIQWVGRETGHRIVFDSPAAERLAIETLLVGRVETDPRTELRLRMLTTDLQYYFKADDGTIHIRLTAAGR